MQEQSDIGNLKLISAISYTIHLLAALTAVSSFLLPGFLQIGTFGLLVISLIDFFFKSEAKGTWLEGHFNWRIRSTIWVGILYLFTSPLWLLLLLPGYIAWLIISIWFLYRIAKGIIAMSNNSPIA